MSVKLKKVMDDRRLSVKECVPVKGSRRGISHNFSPPLQSETTVSSGMDDKMHDFGTKLSCIQCSILAKLLSLRFSE